MEPKAGRAFLYGAMKPFKMFLIESNPVIIVNPAGGIDEAFFSLNSHTVFREVPGNIAVFLLHCHGDIIDSLRINFPSPVGIDAPVRHFIVFKIPVGNPRRGIKTGFPCLYPARVIIIQTEKIHRVLTQDRRIFRQFLKQYTILFQNTDQPFRKYAVHGRHQEKPVTEVFRK